MFCKGPSRCFFRWGGEDFDDDRPGGDPAGATFEETLEERCQWENAVNYISWMFPKIGGKPPKSSHFNRGFPWNKPSISGFFPLLLETPSCWVFFCQITRYHRENWKKMMFFWTVEPFFFEALRWSSKLFRKLGGGFKDFLFSSLKLGEDVHPIWLSHIFQMGWFNHQLDLINKHFIGGWMKKNSSKEIEVGGFPTHFLLHFSKAVEGFSNSSWTC